MKAIQALHLILTLSILLPAKGQTDKSTTNGPCSPSVAGDNNKITIENCGWDAKKFNEMKSWLKKQLSNDAVLRRLDSIENGQTELQGLTTGGDSYSFIVMDVFPDDIALPTFYHVGDYPLHSLGLQISYISAYGGYFVKHQFGDVHTKDVHQVKELELSVKGHNEMEFLIYFNALNGGWSEQLLIRKVDGKWTQAFRVYRPDKDGNNWHVIREEAGSNFPRGADGKVEWDALIHRPKEEGDADITYGFPFLHVKTSK